MATIALRTSVKADDLKAGDILCSGRTDVPNTTVLKVEPGTHMHLVNVTLKDFAGREFIEAMNVGAWCNIIRETEVEVGTPATIRLYTDTVAAVVVKTTKTQVHVRRVETGEEQTVEMKGPWPVREAEGLLDQPVGEVEIYRVNKHGVLAGGGDRSIRLSLGRSVSRTDYSF